MQSGSAHLLGGRLLLITIVDLPEDQISGSRRVADQLTLADDAGNTSHKLLQGASASSCTALSPLSTTHSNLMSFSTPLPICCAISRLVLAGTGAVNDPGLVKSVSRGGSVDELLKGPLYYVIVLIASCVFCWRDSPAGVAAIALMCGGDGMADIFGRRWGKTKLPYNANKTYVGSAAMFVAGAAMFVG